MRVALHQEELKMYQDERGNGQGNGTCCRNAGKASVPVEIWVWISILPMYPGDVRPSVAWDRWQRGCGI